MRTKIVVGVCLTLALVTAGAARGSEYRLEKSFDLSAGASFSLRSEAGGVDVRGGDGAQAVIVVTAERDDFESRYDVRFETSGPDRLEVTIERKGRGPARWFSGPNSGAHVEVELPRSVSAGIRSSGGSVRVSDLAGDLRSASSGGGVYVSGIDGDVHLSSSGGRVEAIDITGELELSSSGGSVVARNIGGDIDASSSGGGVKIEEAHGAVVAGSSGGPVRVGFAAGNASGGHLHSSGGGVTAWLDSGVALTIDAHSSGGRVSCDVPVTVRGKLSRNTVRGQLNGGGPVLKLRSSGGGIHIEER
jgi:hypothetical protein